MASYSETSHRVQWMDKRKRNSAIALSVFGISMLNYCFSSYRYMNSPTMQTMATIALLFAIYKRDPLHKDYFILFWLLISSYHSSTWCGMGFQYICDDFYIYRFFEFIGSLLLLVGIWLVAVIIGYLVYLIYQDYCELIQSNLNTLRIQASNSIPQMVETKEMPPPYAVPISENSSVCHIEPHN